MLHVSVNEGCDSTTRPATPYTGLATSRASITVKHTNGRGEYDALQELRCDFHIGKGGKAKVGDDGLQYQRLDLMLRRKARGAKGRRKVAKEGDQTEGMKGEIEEQKAASR